MGLGWVLFGGGIGRSGVSCCSPGGDLSGERQG